VRPPLEPGAHLNHNHNTEVMKMIGRKTVIGLSLLCALVFSAFAASSAMAVNGTTAFTCVEKSELGAGFSDAHCKTAVPSGAKFIHVEIKQDEETIFHATNAKTNSTTTGAEPAILKGSPLGIETEISCSTVTSHGKITNRLNATKEHRIEGSVITIKYTGCKVTKPAGCVIPKEEILVEGIKATTEGQEMNVKYSPEVGTTFVTITFEKCTNPLANGKHEVKGTARAQPEGATLVFNHNTITNEKTLEFFGANTGLEGKITISQAEKTEETAKTGNPITTTTVT
jgi:hypothetical protein